MPPTLFPSDLDAHLSSAKASSSVVVSGRVLQSDGLDLTIADAFTSLEVELSATSDVAAYDLVTVQGKAQQGKITGATVVSVIRPEKPGPEVVDDLPDEPRTETERFTLFGVGQALVARSVVLSSVRRFFSERRFLDVQTPVLVPCPGLDVHLDPFPVTDRTPRYLATSPELQMKRLLVGGVPRCFQLTPCFRRGEQGSKHNPEFLMLEWYRAFAEVDEVMADTEALVRFVAGELGVGKTLEVEGVEVRLDLPFLRLTVDEAFVRYGGLAVGEAIDLAERDEDAYFRLLVEKVEPALAKLDRPVFLSEYPISQASLARPKPGNPKVAERFELYLGGVELCNGFGELTDAHVQRERMEQDRLTRREKGLELPPIDERFIAALQEGMPPSAGNALGLDRLVALLLGAHEIGHGMAFPEGWL